MKTRIGILCHASGRFTHAENWYRQGLETFLSLHGTRAGEAEVELLYRDIGTAGAEDVRRAAEELIARDGCSLLTGFYLSPDAIAAAPASKAHRVPAVLFNAASHTVLAQSPYYVRVGSSLWQCSIPSAEWAYRTGKRRAWIAVADNIPGRDILAGFRDRFTALGGTVIGEDLMPPATEDFSPYAQRIADAKPDIVQIFVATRISQVPIINALAAHGVFARGIAVIGLGNETDYDRYDEAALGCYSVNHYTPSDANPEDRRFRAAVAARWGSQAEPVSAFAVESYDAMHLLYRMVESQQGRAFDGDAALDAVRGYSWLSPRGKVLIERDTRDVTQDIHIRRLEKIDGRRRNVNLETFAALKDPWAAMQREKREQ